MRTCERGGASLNSLPETSAVIGGNTLRRERARGEHSSVGSRSDVQATQSCNPSLGTTPERAKLALAPGLREKTQSSRKDRKRSDLRVGCINVNSVYQRKEGAERRQELLDEAVRKGLSVVVVVDTRRKGVCDEMWTHKGTGEKWRFMNSGRPMTASQSHQGVGFLISPKLPCNPVFEAVNSRICGLTLSLPKKRLKLIGVYAPTQSVDYADFLQELDAFSTVFCQKRDEYVIVGDLNACVGNDVETHRGLIGAFGERKEANFKGLKLLELLEQKGLTVLNTHFKHHEHHKLTWYSPRNSGEKSMIDMFIGPVTQKRCWINVKAYNDIAIDTDHSLVIGTYRYQYKRLSRPKCSSYEVIRVQRLQTEKVAGDFSESVAEDFYSHDGPKLSLEEDWRLFRDSILNRATEHCGTKTVKLNSRHTGDWWNNEVRKTVEDKRQARKLVREHPTPENERMYRNAKKAVERTIRKAKADSWQRFGERLEENSTEAPKLFWSTVRRLRGQRKETPDSITNNEGKLISDTQGMLRVWSEYFNTLLNPIASESEGTPGMESGTVDDLLPDIEEVARAIASLKTAKASGPDKIQSELLKAMGEAGLLWLTRIIRHSYAKGTVVSDWGESIIVPVFKKGDRRSCTNYRGVSLISHVVKVYSRVLANRLQAVSEEALVESQAGFRPMRSTMDQTFVLRQLFEKRREYNQDTYLAFIDLEKAFDRVDRSWLWCLLAKNGAHKNDIRAIQSLYQYTRSRVRVGTTLSDSIPQNVGLKQGCVLSPVLFTLYINDVLRVNERMSTGVTVGTDHTGTPVRVKHLAFADDVVLLEESEDALQTALEQFDVECEAIGMKISVPKTKVMTLSRFTEVPCTVFVKGEKIEQVDEFVYLGSLFSSDGKVDKDVLKRKSKAREVLAAMYQTIAQKKEVGDKAKLLVYKQVYLPTLLYGSEAWPLSVERLRMVRGPEMAFLRAIKGITRHDKQHNIAVRESLAVEPAMLRLEKSQLRWLGHLYRMDPDRLPAAVLCAQPQGKRPGGKPAKRWIDCVKQITDRLGVEGDQLEEMTSDRDLWRRTVNELKPNTCDK